MANERGKVFIPEVLRAHEIDQLHTQDIPLLREVCQVDAFPDKGKAAADACCQIPLMRYPNNLKALKKSRGWTIDQAAEAIGISRGGYIKIERGENRLTSTTIDLAAKAFGVNKSDIVEDENPRVPILGYAAAGNDSVVFFNDAQGPFDDVPAPDWATKDTVAVRVRGTSLGRFLDGWIAFYDDRRDPPDESLHGQVCVCGLADGRVVVKKLRPASSRGRFHLESETEPTMFDVVVEWAARVREFRQV